MFSVTTGKANTAPVKPILNAASANTTPLHKQADVRAKAAPKSSVTAPVKLPTAKEHSKHYEQSMRDSNANNWRQVQSDLAQMRKALDEEKRIRNERKQELKEKETVLISMLENALREEQQSRTRLEEELSQARNTGNELERNLRSELGQMRQTLDDEVLLRNTREQELREKVTTVKKLQKVLNKEVQNKTRIQEQLSQSRNVCTELQKRLLTEQLSGQSYQQELEAKENAIREERLVVEQERQQKTALEETLSGLQLQMEEERNRHVSTERELQSALSTTQEELTELQRRETRDWIIQREEVTMSGNILGKGAWGIVCEGTFRSCKVAVKEIHELILSDHNRRLFEREMNIASCCRHPNLLQFIGATNDNGSPLFVTELLDTSLRQLFSERALNPEEVINLALDVAKGLNYLHLNKPLPIIHRDISSANVLLWRRDERWRAKLSDYGAANFMRQCMTANPGAMIYSAPEAFTPQQSPKVCRQTYEALSLVKCVS